MASISPAHVFRSPHLGSALNFEETLKTGNLLSCAQYILCFLALGVVVSASDKPLHGLTSFTDRLRWAFHRSHPFTIVFLFFIAGTLENRVRSGEKINRRCRESDAAIEMQQPVSSIPLLPLVPRLPTLILDESG